MYKKPTTHTLYQTGVAYPCYIQNTYSEYDLRRIEVFFAVYMVYVISPLLYTAYITYNPDLMNRLWKIVHSGIFNSVSAIKEFLTNKLRLLMRYFGYTTFSTYTIVKNGIELYSSHSEYVNIQTTRKNIKKYDMAKYKVCKWIDSQCDRYKLKYNDHPDVSDDNNDIYDFIVHTSSDYKQVRIHRGDFRISTHTQFEKNYRTYCNLNQIDDYAELIVPNMDSNENEVDVEDERRSEIIYICIKEPEIFYVEKNILFDKAFLKWFLINKLNRSDIADYIGTFDSKYEIRLYNKNLVQFNFYENQLCTPFLSGSENTEVAQESVDDSQKGEELKKYFMILTSGENLVVGSKYLVKQDSILKCPIYTLRNNNTISIDDSINQYYYESDYSLTDDESIDNKNKNNNKNNNTVYDDTEPKECDIMWEDTDTDDDVNAHVNARDNDDGNKLTDIDEPGIENKNISPTCSDSMNHISSEFEIIE
jgi:hypothetical protein